MSILFCLQNLERTQTMNKKIEDLYRAITTGIYAVRPTRKWAKATLTFKSIELMNESVCSCVLDDALTISLNSGFEVDDALAELRTEMARLHENGDAWYSAECDVDPDGKYAFRFDYDHLPSFSVIPSPSKWIHEFSKYPRPQLKASIQDWIDGKVESEQIVKRLQELQSN